MIITITLHRSDKPDEPLIKLNMPADRSGLLKWLSQGPDGDLLERTDAGILRFRAFDFQFYPVILMDGKKEFMVPEQREVTVVSGTVGEVLMTGRKFRLLDGGEKG